MKKKRLELDRKLVLKKRIVTELNENGRHKVMGGGQTQQSSPVVQNCLCEFDPNYTRICPTNQFQLTCRAEDCGLANSAISCFAGVGCASGNNECMKPVSQQAHCTIWQCQA